MIEYVSTRDCGENTKKYSSAEAIKMGRVPAHADKSVRARRAPSF